MRAAAVVQKNRTATPADAPKTPAQSEGRIAYEQQKELAKRKRKLSRAAEDAEKEVSQLEAAVKLLEDRMNSEEGAKDDTLFGKHASLSKQLDKAMEEWETAESELEEFLAQNTERK